MHLRTDADIFLYRCAFAAEKTKYLNQLFNPHSTHAEYKEFDTKKEAEDYAARVGATNYLWSRKDLKPESEVAQIVDAAIDGVLAAYPNHKPVFYLTGTGNFREAVAKTKPYKGNRADVPKPHYYKLVKSMLEENYDATIVTGHEADDQIGMDYKDGDVIVSTDKDLDQIPGLHYDWVKREEYTVTPKQAKTRFFIQLLAGDPVDNIPGINGIGEAKAAKALADCKNPLEMMQVCIDMYAKAGLADILVEQARLVYIKRDAKDWLDTKDGQCYTQLLSRSAQASSSSS